MPAPCQKEASLSAPVVTQKYFRPQPHNRSKGFEKEEQRCARGSLLRARAWRESALHWGTCGSRVAAAAATNTVTSIGAHRCHHDPQCSTTDASEQGPPQLARKKPTTWPRAGGVPPTCARERHWISLHPAAFSFGRCFDESLYSTLIVGTNHFWGKPSFGQMISGGVLGSLLLLFISRIFGKAKENTNKENTNYKIADNRHLNHNCCYRTLKILHNISKNKNIANYGKTFPRFSSAELRY